MGPSAAKLLNYVNVCRNSGLQLCQFLLMCFLFEFRGIHELSFLGVFLFHYPFAFCFVFVSQKSKLGIRGEEALMDPFQGERESELEQSWSRVGAELERVGASWRELERVRESARECERVREKLGSKRERVGAELERVGESWRELERVGESWRELERVRESWRGCERVGESWRECEGCGMVVWVSARGVV